MTPFKTKLMNRSGPKNLALAATFFGVAMLSTPAMAQERSVLTKAQWPAQRTGTTMTRIESLQRVMAQVQKAPQSVVLVRYPGGNLGNAWAVELRDWLVALGLDSGRVRLEPGSGIADAITLTVLNN